MKLLIVCAFLVAATLAESSGDALVRMGLFERRGLARVGALSVGAALLFAYGVLLNLAPMPFERVVGIYIATLFIVWQAVSFVAFRSVPTVPVLLGGALVIGGGLIVAFWTRQ